MGNDLSGGGFNANNLKLGCQSVSQAIVYSVFRIFNRILINPGLSQWLAREDYWITKILFKCL